MISRRDDESVPIGTLRRSLPTGDHPQGDNKEIGQWRASPRAGEFGQSSALLVARVSQDTLRSSRLEYCPNSLRSIDASSNPALRGERELKALPLATQRRIQKKLRDNADLENPLTRARTLTNLPPATHRFRIGKYRASFFIAQQTIFVERIEVRG
jgi:mRNA-degrading endonuclease RelE of RelBE toxin-antitoxin system